ncbi:DNA polymerase/3'-5' exonuclease PolX [Mesorhizobium jarvisii]|uniref:DNA polymerase/3'-5' exonuclease PolX n=1 Tax=Mesorhizobium jarvisii TaxID=1777867 RepID=UPI001F0B1712|nr:DNA polymerase/3'-5' exonuclease PolX [Mesorhizobium jarvisii]MCH4560738.1 DNA polymerase/3'-5' exonuclease PolX [Mesorhizobium jarvisii]
MGIHNADISAMLNRMADLLEIEAANPFRIRAYRRAAATIDDLPENIPGMLAEGRPLSDLPGIGEDLAGKIEEFVNTGHLQALEEVEARTPSTLAALTAIPGLGPKRVHTLHEALGIKSLDDLAKAAKTGKIRDLPRFSAAAEAKILDEIGKHRKTERRFKISTAEDFANGLTTYLKAGPGIERVVVAGSFRRRKETVGDLDILVTCEKGPAAIDHFAAYDEIAEVISKGTTRSTVLLKAGMQVDVRVVPEESYGAALHYFTGSKAHNIAVRKLAQAKGLKLNEYGVFKGSKRIAGRTEEEVFRTAGLPFIEPELREDRGEIEAAQVGKLPALVALSDIRGDLHAHTKASDGKSSLAEMAEAAKASGYEYLAISDHSRHATVAHGLDAKRLGSQLDEIDRMNDQFGDFRLLKSCEVDILADGKLDLPDGILKRLDFTVCAVHFRFELNIEEQTQRILRAMDNRYFNILAHPTGRLLGERPGYAVDLDRVIEAAKEHGCFLEVNAHPTRLDLDDIHCRQAKEAGVKLAISTDAHSTVGLNAMRYGVDQARRGWIEASDVLNTRPWKELKGLFAR